MNNLDNQYISLLNDILTNGVKKEDRTGTGTISVFGRQIRHKMSEGFPLLTTKKIAWKTMVTELLWFLRGDTNIKFLVDNNCNIWNGDAYKGYEKECVVHGVDPMSMEQFIQGIKNYKDDRDWIEKIKSPATHFIPDLTGYQLGDLGPVYGKQWRKWTEKSFTDILNRKISYYGNTEAANETAYEEYKNSNIDQIQNLINELKTNPDSRRLMVNAWNVGELDQMVLPPCHYGFQVYTSELSDERRYNIWFNNNYETGMERFFDPNNLPDFDNSYYTPTPKRTISLMWNQRSVDTFLGLPFNIASYALLLKIIAREVNMVPDELVGNLGDVHLYSNHIEQAKEQITRIPYNLPKVQISERKWYQHEKVKEYLGEKTFNEKILSYRPDCFDLINYKSHDKIKAPLSN